jgi:hypothetical protein
VAMWNVWRPRDTYAVVGRPNNLVGLHICTTFILAMAGRLAQWWKGSRMNDRFAPWRKIIKVETMNKVDNNFG